MTNSRLRARRRPAPDDDIAFIFLLITYSLIQSVWMQQGTDVSTQKGWILSKANTRIPNSTYNMGVHSCLATSSWLYDGTHTGCAFALQCYHL